jgi:acetate kinase
MSEKKMSAKEIERFLYNDCGLKGLSGISNDVRDLLASSDPRAKLALDYFVYRISLFAGMLAAAMGGMDGFVFTAGIGENAPSIRDAVMRRLSWLGVEIASEANAKGKTRISREASRVACFVIPTDEELMIARHTLRMLREQPAAPLRERRA